MTDVSDYPPLASLEAMPLHPPEHLGPGMQYACLDLGAVYPRYDWRCPDCAAAAEKRIRVFGDVTVTWRPGAGPEERTVMLSWLVARSRCLGTGVGEG